jgi:hypothetical protein
MLLALVHPHLLKVQYVLSEALVIEGYNVRMVMYISKRSAAYNTIYSNFSSRYLFCFSSAVKAVLLFLAVKDTESDVF